MKRVSAVVGLAVVVCMAISVCYADEGTALLTGNKNSIGQSAQGFMSVDTAFAGQLSGFSGTTVESAMQLLSGGSGISVISSWDGVGTDAFEITNLNELGADPFSPQIMNDCDRSSVWNFIQPFHEKAMAAVKLPAQSTRDFMKDVKAGTVSKESAEAYVAQLDACASAYKTAFEQAVSDWMKENQAK